MQRVGGRRKALGEGRFGDLLCQKEREAYAKARSQPGGREGSGRWRKLSEEPEGAKGEAVPGAPTSRSRWDQKSVRGGCLVPALLGDSQSKGRVSHLPEPGCWPSPPSNYSVRPQAKATLGKMY